eukprot:8331829-Heterocapsa_arctica.AAC.1
MSYPLAMPPRVSPAAAKQDLAIANEPGFYPWSQLNSAGVTVGISKAMSQDRCRLEGSIRLALSCASPDNICPMVEARVVVRRMLLGWTAIQSSKSN